MTGLFIALAVVCYLFFFIDWKEFRSILAKGGWATLAIYCVVTVLIWYTLSAPQAVAHAPVHH